MRSRIDTALARQPDGELVEQAIDAGAAAAFRKWIIPVPLASGGSLFLVRKRAASLTGTGGASRGALLLLHGYAQNRYAWHTSRRSLANFLAQGGFDVFNLDLRGAGRSRAAGTRPPRGFSDHVEEDVPAAVGAALRESGERRVFLVGHSLGGAIACAFAGRAPEQVRGVVTLSGLYTFGRGNGFVRLLGRAAAALERSRVVPPALVPRMLPTDVIGRALRLTRGGWNSRLARLAPLQAWAPGSIEDDVLSEAIGRSFEPASLAITLGLARMAAGGGFADAAGRCYFRAFEERTGVPLLVATACSDRLVPPEDARACYERSRSRDRALLRLERGAGEGAGGWGHIDLLLGRRAPARVWPAVRDWLRAR